jgi:hypothetical protein
MQYLFRPMVKAKKAVLFFFEEVFQSETKKDAIRWKKYLAG